jgi:hypothetical protein
MVLCTSNIPSPHTNYVCTCDIEMDVCLLQAVAPYKNRDPHSEEEAEYLNNLFNAMCACLMTPEGRSLFVAAEVGF